MKLLVMLLCAVACGRPIAPAGGVAVDYDGPDESASWECDDLTATRWERDSVEWVGFECVSENMRHSLWINGVIRNDGSVVNLRDHEGSRCSGNMRVHNGRLRGRGTCVNDDWETSWHVAGMPVERL